MKSKHVRKFAPILPDMKLGIPRLPARFLYIYKNFFPPVLRIQKIGQFAT